MIPPPHEHMKTALFTNFSKEAFVGYWNGKPKKFAPGQSVYMPDYLARHFAKHLTNRELLRNGLERDTSPKVKIRPDGTEYIDNEKFNELFNKAYMLEKEEQMGEEADDVDTQISVENKNRRKAKNVTAKGADKPGKKGDKDEQDPTQPQIISSPDDDEDDEEFAGKPVE